VRIEDQEEFVDQVAQAVIDKIEERDRIDSMVGLVVARVLALQKEQKEADAVLAEAAHSNGNGLSERSLQEKTYVEQS
jgi:hypothetical protein